MPGKKNRTRRYEAHFLIAKDGGQWSALCYEFGTVGCGETPEEALDSVIHSTIEYLEYLIGEGREAEAPRPAPPSLVCRFADLDVDGEVTAEHVYETCRKLWLSHGVLQRKALVRYDARTGKLLRPPPPPAFSSAQAGLAGYPAELVLSGV